MTPTTQNAPAVLAVHVRELVRQMMKGEPLPFVSLIGQLEGIAEQLEQLAAAAPDPAGGV